MNLLELVNKARERAGVKKAALSTVASVSGMDADLVMWVQDAWRDLQMESTNWWFRTAFDQTLALAASDDDYAMPANLETLNYRTITVYLTTKTDESKVSFVRYEDWRMAKDTVSTSEGRPTLITERPDGVLQVWPVPDQIYTLRFDGVWDIDEMTADADTPGDTINAGTQMLANRYHYYLIWDAVARYAATHEDGPTLERAQKYMKQERSKLSERQTPPVYVKPGVLTGRTQSFPYRGHP